LQARTENACILTARAAHCKRATVVAGRAEFPAEFPADVNRALRDKPPSLARQFRRQFPPPFPAVMPITREQIARIAHLARLATAPAEAAEAEEYAAQLSRILELVEQMNRIDTDGVAPLSHPQQLAEAALRLRADEVTETDRRADYQLIAPAAADGLYLVPRVIE